MKELTLLKNMWSPRHKRTTKLIVDNVTYENLNGSLHNDNWAYKVTYAFRDALDIKYEERKKNKKPYMVWTQGPIINFKDGDLIHARDGLSAIQVKFSNPMGWDTSKNEMYLGSVVFDEYDISDHKFTVKKRNTVTQMQFLQLVITGHYDS